MTPFSSDNFTNQRIKWRVTMARFASYLSYFTALFTVCFCTSYAHAQWTLVNEDSSISFVSVKNAAVAEVHNFKKLNGKISEDGKIAIGIDLDSVNTFIQIRDERIRKMLLETGLYPRATITTEVKSQALKELKAGESILMPVSFVLDLHGIKKSMTSEVMVIALNNQRVLVTTTAPLTMNLSDHKLIKGINNLREIAKLSSISSSVAVTAQLVFTR
jgi:polyisoprenoid-binding protein YceI